MMHTPSSYYEYCRASSLRHVMKGTGLHAECYKRVEPSYTRIRAHRTVRVVRDLCTSATRVDDPQVLVRKQSTRGYQFETRPLGAPKWTILKPQFGSSPLRGTRRGKPLQLRASSHDQIAALELPAPGSSLVGCQQDQDHAGFICHRLECLAHQRAWTRTSSCPTHRVTGGR